MGAVIDNFDFTFCGKMGGIERVKLCETFDWFMNFYPWFSNNENKARVVSQKAIEQLQRTPQLMYLRHKYVDYGEEKFQSFGDWCYDRYLFDVVAYILRDKKGATIPNANGMTLGMRCARRGYEKLAMNCVDNKEAMTQLSKEGKNIVMYGAERNLIELVMQGIQHDEVATLQRKGDGKTVGMLVASKIPTDMQKAIKHIELLRILFNHDGARDLKDCNGVSMFDILNKEFELVRSTLSEVAPNKIVETQSIIDMYQIFIDDITSKYFQESVM